MTCLDMKRVKGSQTLFLVAGHAKGQLCLFEIKGLPKYQQQPTTRTRATSIIGKINPVSNPISFKCLKTVSDLAQG